MLLDFERITATWYFAKDLPSVWRPQRVRFLTLRDPLTGAEDAAVECRDVDDPALADHSKHLARRAVAGRERDRAAQQRQRPRPVALDRGDRPELERGNGASEIGVLTVAVIFSTGKCSGNTGPSPASNTERSIALRNSRMFPGQE